MKEIAAGVGPFAASSAQLTIQKSYPVTVNDSTLVARMLPTLARVVGKRALGTR
jgi:hypothetical protein